MKPVGDGGNLVMTDIVINLLYISAQFMHYGGSQKKRKDGCAVIFRSKKHDEPRADERLILLTPVLVACGIGSYYLLKFEPFLPFTLLVFSGAAAGLYVSRHIFDMQHPRYRLGLVVLALFAVLLGFTAASVRTAMVNTPMLERSIKFAEVSGKVSALEIKASGGQRLTLTALDVEELSAKNTPRYVRLTLRKPDDALRVGDYLRVLANLMPPSPPVQPGAFDFQRYSFFNQIGATGFIYKVQARVPAQGLFLLQRLGAVRAHIGRIIIEGASSADHGGVMAALMTGVRSGINEADAEAMRGSGLAHMLAISGLHVGLFAGAIFFAARLIMALIPGAALRRPIKKYAAACAILGAFIYMLIAGASIPTQRAMIMTFVFFLAIMLDRSPISMRLVAVAACIILLLQPESLISASFQMSFSAVAALVYVYGATRHIWQAWGRGAGWLRKGSIYVAGVMFTSLIAGFATAPFALYHFQQVALYSIPANMLAVPILGFWVMPAMMVTLMCVPFSGHGWSARIMEEGVALILSVAHNVSALEAAVFITPAWPLLALISCVAAGLSLILCRGYFKGAAAVFLMVTVVFIFTQKKPDILVSSSAKLMAFRGDDGALSVSSRRADRFVRENWLRLNGQDPDGGLDWRAYERTREKGSGEGIEESAGRNILRCDTKSCLLTLDNGEDTLYHAAFPARKSALTEDCGVADIVVAPFSISYKTCGAARHIDYYSMKYRGAQAIYIDNGHVNIVSDRDVRGYRPWVLLPKSKFD